MSHTFSRSGIRFEYPENWRLEVEDSEGGWSASAFSSATAFFMLSYHADEADPAILVDAALAAMQENYPDLEAEPTIETLSGLPCIGHDVEFIALDLTNTCWIRGFATVAGCALVMCQCTDEELAGNGAVLRAIRASIAVEDEV